jgi:hypothetical protein
MEPSAASAATDRAPLPHERLFGSGYGLVLVLILISLAFQLGAPDDEWARVVTLVIQTGTLLAALHVSVVPLWLFRAAAVFGAVAILAAAGVLIGTGELGEAATRGVGLMLVILAPAAILLGMVRQFRAVGHVTLTTMFAVLCVYLLLGMAFGFLYGLVSAIQDAQFFSEGQREDQSDFLYFSFTTLTTTGYGDFTAATSLGRSLAITEALIGQIYLVTVVAVIVGNIGRQPRVSR